MSSFKKEYDLRAAAIVTNALVMVADELKEGQPYPPYVYTENAAWDTGAEITGSASIWVTNNHYKV